MTQPLTLEKIFADRNLVSYDRTHILLLRSMFEDQKKRGRNVRFHPVFNGERKDVLEKFRAGYCMLECPQVGVDFVILCLDEGKRWYGTQKRSFELYRGSVEADEFSAAVAFSGFSSAMARVYDVFKEKGL